MVFRRRDRRPIWRVVLEFFWPRGGWGRAAQYVKHRLHRLPGSPEQISRGIWAGVFTTFTPFYGMHFVVAGILAFVMRGNILAALMGTFFGNPLTYVPIGVISMRTGYYLLDLGPPPGLRESGDHQTLVQAFAGAGSDLWHNIKALFNREVADWSRLSVFYDEVFFPYMIGGIVPGIITATITYYLSVPLIRAYQKRRARKLREKFDAKQKTMVAQQNSMEQVADVAPKGD